MSNIDDAVDVMQQTDSASVTANNRYASPHQHAQALAGAGLLAPAAPDMRSTIAAMEWEWEWRRECRIIGGSGVWEPLHWRGTRQEAADDTAWWCTPKGTQHEYRLVRRPVGPVEVAE